MEDFRRSSHRPAGGEVGGWNSEIIDANMFKYVNKVYFGGPQPSFEQKTVHKKKKSSSMSIMSWLNEPKMKRKMRLAKYKMYTLEGKLKDSFKKGHKWIKNKYRKLVHGY